MEYPITYFDPFEDELLYSFFARFQLFTGLSKHKIHEIFYGNKKTTAKFLVSNTLDSLCSKLGEPYSPKHILSKHSVYNYYAPFISSEDQDIAYNCFLGSGSLGSRVLRLMNNYFDKVRFKYCPTCVKEDIEQHSISYFHISHNLNGITVCHKHGFALNDYPNDNTSLNQYIYLDERKVTYITKEVLYPEINQKLAKLANQLITTDILKLSRESVVLKIKNILNKKGLVKSSNIINQKELADMFIKFYGNDFLNSTGNNIDIKDNHNWLRIATRDYNGSITPLRYLLLINMLAKSIQDFVEVDTNLCKTVCLNSGIELKKRLTKKNSFNNEKKEYDKDLDLNYLVQFKDAYDKLKKYNPSKRITKTILQRMIGKPEILRSGRYPLSLEFVISVEESVEDARYRRCKYIIDEYINSKTIPDITQVRDKAKIHCWGKYPTLLSKVEMYIKQRLNNNC